MEINKKMLKVQFCKRGHDISIAGLTQSNHCKKCVYFTSRRWILTHKEKTKTSSRNGNWKTVSMINADGSWFTTVDFDRAYQIQGGKCLGCGVHQSELDQALCADHNHTTGVFRFLLCNSCNLVMGRANDNPFLLHKLASLLEDVENNQTRSK